MAQPANFTGNPTSRELSHGMSRIRYTLATAMDAAFKRLTPSEAWEEAERRSAAISIAGWFVVSAFQAAGAIPTLYPSLAPVFALVAAFLAALAMHVASYHNRWRLGACVTAVSLCLPYILNFLWVRFSGQSLLYPLAVFVVGGVTCLWFLHRGYSGSTLEDDGIEEALIRKILEDEELKSTWMDRVTALCFVVALVLFLILLLR